MPGPLHVRPTCSAAMPEAVPITELTLTGGVRLLVQGEPRTVEAAVLSAARGSLMELAWLVDAATGLPVGVNPEHVLMLRVPDPSASESSPNDRPAQSRPASRFELREEP